MNGKKHLNVIDVVMMTTEHFNFITVAIKNTISLICLKIVCVQNGYRKKQKNVKFFVQIVIKQNTSGISAVWQRVPFGAERSEVQILYARLASYFTGTLDTKPNQPYNTKATIQNNVSDSKVQKDVSTLQLAANGEIYLDVKNPKLYKKVRRFYENEGVVFSGDPLDDYEMLMEYVASDLEVVEVEA